jgi:RNA polymerase sigma factor (sigma-70 family)
MTTTDPLSLLPTRRSLLSRLKDWRDQDSWRDFFNTYWKLIYTVARKAGLDESEAQDVVQDTVTTVAKEMKNFQYDRSRGTFKGWLRLITKRRVADSLRKRYRRGEGMHVNADDTMVQDEMAAMDHGDVDMIDQVWETEWQVRVLEAAMDRVKSKVSPVQFQVFELFVLKGCPIREVTSAFGMSRVAVYVACHRVKKLLKVEGKRLESQML